MTTIKAYIAEFAGMSGYYAAAKRSRASAMAARDLVDAGWARNWHEALKGLRVIRAPDRDVDALSRGRDGALR